MSNDKVKSKSGAPLATGGAKKQSTTELPVVPLTDVVKFVQTIHDKALETAPLPQVAKGVGYETQTSTPFYRKLLASRLFGLISPGGAALTKRANDFIKPDQEDGKLKALQDAVTGISYYNTLLEKYGGRKLNTELVTNAISKDFNLCEPLSILAANAFALSIKFAGMLADDGIVGPPIAAPPTPPTSETPAGTPPGLPETIKLPPGVPEVFSDQEEHYLYLDKEKSKKVTFNCPLFISQAEYDRICNWIKATWIIEKDNSA